MGLWLWGFSHPRLIADRREGVIDEPWVAALDLTTPVRRLNAKLHAESLQRCGSPSMSACSTWT